MVFIYLIYVWHGSEMQFEWFNSLLTLPNLGIVCDDDNVRVQPYRSSTTVDGVQIPYICMTWMWNAV
jgi:hypothetical protein